MARIAVDFDDTLIETDAQGNLTPISGAAMTCRSLKLQGHQIIIFTCRIEIARQNGSLEDDIAWIEDVLQKFEIPFDEIFIGGKVIADLYVDDRNIAFKGNWAQAETEIQEYLELYQIP